MNVIALDMLGGDGAPDVVADAVALSIAHDGPDLMLVGPVQRCAQLLADRGIVDHPRISFRDAQRSVPMDGDPLRAVREFKDVTVRVGASAVASGEADAFVSAGHSGAAVAASVFELGRTQGVSRPPLAVVLPALAGSVVLLDVGAGTTASIGLIEQFALVGVAYARALGIEDPSVGLLTIGSEPGKGDELRRDADPQLRALLASAGVRYAGCVEGFDVALGKRANVIVTDGFTGNVLLKGIEGTVIWAAESMGARYGDTSPAFAVAAGVAASDFAGGMLLGVNGVSVIAHGAATPEAIVACIGLADRAVSGSLVARTKELVVELMERRS